ncbi:MAG: hypothetical protein IVW53_06305 [Chloroflexi bacterium]|nr:hypothetical protein [Chloroflexota bacterium]
MTFDVIVITVPDMSTGEGRPSLKVRFDDSENYRLLRLIAGRLGVSMNSLAEDMIGRELRVLAEGMEMDLTETIALLRRYRAREPEQQAADFARAEVEYDDPLKSKHLSTRPGDPFGVEAAFGYALER